MQLQPPPSHDVAICGALLKAQNKLDEAEESTLTTQLQARAALERSPGGPLDDRAGAPATAGARRGGQGGGAGGRSVEGGGRAGSEGGGGRGAEGAARNHRPVQVRA